MHIPNAENAVVDVERKLRGYCLNLEHPHGGTHAQKFQNKLGLTANNAEWLGDVLREVVKTPDAELREADEFGERYRVEFMLVCTDKQSSAASGWITKTSEDFPRLVTCYLLD